MELAVDIFKVVSAVSLIIFYGMVINNTSKGSFWHVFLGTMMFKVIPVMVGVLMLIEVFWP